MERDFDKVINNYEDWLLYQYGKYFTDKYTKRYTRKYWCCEASELTTEWVTNRMYTPSIDEVLYGSFTDKTPNTYYAKEMRYPENGGYSNFFEHIATGLDIKLNHEVVKIDVKNKMIYFKNEFSCCYEKLITSLPLPKTISFIEDSPIEIKEASKRLYSTSICLVSVAFKKVIKMPSLWFYVYDEEIPYARAYSPSMKSSNNSPKDTSSLQFEIYYTEKNGLIFSEEELKLKVVESIESMNIASKEDILFIDLRNVKYANVVFYDGMEQDRKICLDYLDSINVKSIGRFGKWDYLWSDESFLSGYLGN